MTTWCPTDPEGLAWEPAVFLAPQRLTILLSKACPIAWPPALALWPRWPQPVPAEAYRQRQGQKACESDRVDKWPKGETQLPGEAPPCQHVSFHCRLLDIDKEAYVYLGAQSLGDRREQPSCLFPGLGTGLDPLQPALQSISEQP